MDKELYKVAKRTIQEASENNQLVLFVGAGISINSGMPSWKDAIQKIADLLGITKISDSDFLKIPQYYYNAHGKQAYNDLMHKIFKANVNLPISKIHRKLLRFNAQTIITTNYDNLIERTCEESGEIRQVISHDIDIPYSKYNKKLIKMHGDFVHDNFVLKEDDYLNYSKNFKLIENHIRSIIGSKVLLFVGYSFNDPDLKQIFSWIKNILGDNRRIAYLINASDEYNENEVAYYKNLGVEIIYAQRLLNQDAISSCVGERLNATLDYFLSRRGSSLLDDIYNELKKYFVFSYITIEQLNQSLEKYNFFIDGNMNLTTDLDNEEKNNFLKLLVDSQDNINELYKIKKINEVLHKSMIKGIKINNNVNEFPEDLEGDRILKYAYSFNWKGLNELKNENEVKLNDSNGKQLLQQAAITYYLGDFFASYNYLKRAGIALFKEKSYVLYCVSQINRKYIGNILINNSHSNKLNKKILDTIKDEIDNINIDKLLYDISDINNSKYLIQKIDHLTLIYSQFMNLYNLSLRTIKEAETDYALYVGTPAFEKAKIKMIDLHNFYYKNYLLSDEHYAINNFYKLYIKLSIQSLSEKNSNKYLSMNNIKKEYLDDFDVFLIIKYFTNSSDIYELLENNFKNLQSSYFELNDKGIKYLECIIPNIINSNYYNDKNKELYWKLLALCGFVKLNKNIVQLILDSLSDYLKSKVIVERNKKIIWKLLSNIKDQNLFSKNSSKSKLQKILDSISKVAIKEVSDVIFLLNSYLKEIDNNYDNKKIVDYAIDKNADDVIINLFEFADESSKEGIRNYFKNKNLSNLDDNSVEEAETILDAVDNDIIDLNDNNKKIIFGYLLNRDTSAERFTKIKDLTHNLVRLYITNKINLTSQEIDIIDKYAMSRDKWLIKYKTYNYQELDLSWLCCEQDILKQISSDKNIKKKIQSKLIQAYRENKLSSKLIWVYFNYFV